jgi:lipoprotein-anchoring transpeptidase ErfK/SrfK
MRVLATVGIVALGGLALGGCSAGGTASPDAAAQPAPSATAAPFSPEPEPQAGAPAPAPAKPAHPRPEGRHLLADLDHAVRLRARPGGRVLRRIGTRTEFGSHTILSVTARRRGWLQVLTPKLPNHRRGWIPAGAATLSGTDYDIRVDRSARRAVLRRAGRTVLAFRVAVGRPGNETPLGRFAVTDKLRPHDATSPYGCCAVALTGHQTRLEPGWPGGDRLAIHGTPATWTIGRAISLGCMRADARPLKRLLRRVPLGAPVRIVA